MGQARQSDNSRKYRSKAFAVPILILIISLIGWFSYEIVTNTIHIDNICFYDEEIDDEEIVCQDLRSPGEKLVSYGTKVILPIQGLTVIIGIITGLSARRKEQLQKPLDTEITVIKINKWISIISVVLLAMVLVGSILLMMAIAK